MRVGPLNTDPLLSLQEAPKELLAYLELVGTVYHPDTVAFPHDLTVSSLDFSDLRFHRWVLRRRQKIAILEQRFEPFLSMFDECFHRLVSRYNSTDPTPEPAVPAGWSRPIDD